MRFLFPFTTYDCATDFCPWSGTVIGKGNEVYFQVTTLRYSRMCRKKS